jgi:hypothetical protein
MAERAAAQLIDAPEPPEVLYKYLPPERIDILENMEIRFSRPSEFNDTFDADYLVPISQGAKAKSDRLRLRAGLGIFCLTEQPNDHLMWVHYARNHSGFVIGFTAKACFFRDNERRLDKVRYRKGPEVLAVADTKVCFYKSNIWRHEREWRCVRSFNSSESRSVGIVPELITQIIIGSRMEAWQIARIMVCKTGFEMDHTQFLLSTPLRKSWSFENRPKTMSLCDKCGGDGYLMKDQA